MEERSVHSSISDINSEDPINSRAETQIIPRKQRICLVGAASDDPTLGTAAQKFSVPVLKSRTGFEYIEDTSYCTYFILKEFEGHEYEVLHKSPHRLLGPTALVQLAEKKETLPSINRPTYTMAMYGNIVVFTGFRVKDELMSMVNKVHNMGGSIRKEMGGKITHLIANFSNGDKYRYAATFRVPIMSMQWVTALWEERDVVTSYSSDPNLLLRYKLKPFCGASMLFCGFPEEEKKHMCDVLIEQGGKPVENLETHCTHVVVDESNVSVLPELAPTRAHIVKAEWFWTSVQNECAADEKEYSFEDYLESVSSPVAVARKSSLHQIVSPSSSASTRRKRKRLQETLSSLVQIGSDSPGVPKRRSSISDAGHLSVSGSFLDCTASPDKLDNIPEVESANFESSRKNLSPRHLVFLELVETESNYVGVLSTIMTLFKSPLEDLVETHDELLNSTELKIIFGNFSPIYQVHKNMLNELKHSANHWTENVGIGNIFLKYSADLVKAYPPYVNFFENTKDMLEQCDQKKPRFHAFLKICQSKPECGRQSLKELLIKPIQRLPSIKLLLTDILKHTKTNNPDYSALDKSISSVDKVLTSINEDKRKTESQMAIFDIFNEIENCPAHLVSSHRAFIGRCDVVEISDCLSGRGDNLVLFLFNDTIEISKKRSKAYNSMKSPNTVNGLHSLKIQGKPYKHICLLSLIAVKKVVDIRDSEECQKAFALVVRQTQELKENNFIFTIADEDVNKINYLKTLCRQMAINVCKPDAESFLKTVDSNQFEIGSSDTSSGTLSKAFKFATRTRMKVGRALSFNKTPSKLKRAMSTVMSPFGSSTHSLTPASQAMAQMKLASCNNINELGNGSTISPSRDDVLVAPMSVQPTRKAKCGTISGALRRF